MQMTVKTKGFKELDKILSEQLPKATTRRVLVKVSKGALEPMADDAAQKAPERTGKLAYSIAVSEGRTRRAKTTWRRSQGVQMAMGPSTGLGTLNYATFDEFGTVDTPAFGFMRGAWDSGVMKALDYVQDNLWREVERAVGRVRR